MGYDKEEMCIHGFRSIWSTRMRELGNYPEAVIEKQLAHKNGDKVAEAYDRATYIDLRRNALQFWADYLDDLRSVYSRFCRSRAKRMRRYRRKLFK